uniref:Muscarinic acetylcholine receptor n=1 Tax=Astyanax mexicanus TaxID=7994 RepID=A0A3B1K3F3_ASTMX
MNATTASFTLSNVTNDTAEPAGGPITWRMAMITLITVPLSVITIIGNILVIVSFRVNPLLRTVSNYFLLSLAVADLILGTISMNLYTTYILLGRWTLGNLACDVWLAVDYVASNASVMNLLAISFDRYLSVTRPLTYRASRTTKRAALMISLAWGVSFILWAPAILFWQHIVGERTVAEDQCSIQFLSEPVITFGTAIAAFYLPVCVMVALYWKVYRETEKRSQQLAGLMASRGGDTKKPWNDCINAYKLGETSSRGEEEVSLKLDFMDQFHQHFSTMDTPGSSLSQTRAQRSRKPRSWSLVREKKAARTLSAILLAFIVTWTPYNIMVLVSTFCDDCVPEGLWQLGYWLCYVNSTVNPVCYALCNKQFRVTFKALLLCRWKELRRGTRWAMSRGS